MTGSADAENMPSTELDAASFAAGLTVVDALALAGLVKSKGEGRRLVQQGGVSLNDEKVADPMRMLTDEDFEKGYAVLKKGKKVFHKLVLHG